MSKLKIGFVFDDSLDKPDGVQQYILALGDWLRDQGHDVHYLVGATSRTDIQQVHSLSKNVAVRYNGNRLSIPRPTSRRVITTLLRNEQFDVLHVQVPYSPFMAQRVIAAADARTAVVGTFHIVAVDKLVSVSNRLLAQWNGRTLRRFDAMFSVSAAAQAFAKRTYHLQSTVLPNVVAYQRFAAAKPLIPTTTKLRIVFLGRLVPRKGCLILLQAIELLKQRAQLLPDYELIVCGRGPLEAELKEFVRARQLGLTIRFAGFVSEADKPGYLRSADIAVFPSTGGESFGIVLLEAMAAGTAVLGGDNAGYRTVLEDRPEALVPVHDVAALADKLAWLLTDTKARQDLRSWGQQYASRFDTATIGRKLVAYYEDALRKRRGVR